MERERYKSRFMMNQVGFLPTASKLFTYCGVSKKFQVNRLQDLVLTPVFEGVIHTCDDTYGIGDFTELTEEGIYRISTEEGNSRCFIIGRNAYGTTARVLTGYFTWQRCGDDLGWNGRCHSDDEIIFHSGERRRLAGGHHQSSDLRKWAYGTSIGIEGLAEYALTEHPLWDKGGLAEDLWHSVKYYLSLITKEGWMLDCTWVPEGYDKSKAGIGYGDYEFSWKRRQYFESPDNEHTHWQVIKVLSLAARYFAETDREKSEKCLEGAERIWNYMETEGRQMHDYDLPLYPPLGHDGMKKMYQGFYEGSALRHASRAIAACRLYLVKKDDRYKKAVFEALDALCRLQAEGDVQSNPASACFWESPESSRLANNYYYFFNINVPMAFADALEIWPDAESAHCWMECMCRIAEQHVLMSGHNPFGRVPATWHTAGHDIFAESAIFSFSTETCPVKQQNMLGKIAHKGEIYEIACEDYSFCYNLDLLATGVFLCKAAKLTGCSRYRETAQRQMDWLLGANQFDASSVEGVGYNQPHRGVFGEFFPPVPQIPGAVFTGITEESFQEEAFGYDCEYDMTMVGWMLYLIAQVQME